MLRSRFSLDFPISTNRQSLTDFDSIAYYLDFYPSLREAPFDKTVFDYEGFPMWDYSGYPPPNNIGKQYSVILAPWYALANINRYEARGDAKSLDIFFRMANWLLNRAQKMDGRAIRWLNNYCFYNHNTLIQPPWQSSMAQGLALSVMVRAYKLSADKKYLKAAKEAAELYMIDIEDGGIRFEEEGYIYYEMYPAKPFSKILDGFIFGLIGLYDIFRLTHQKQYWVLFQEASRTIEAKIDFWDFKNKWSRYGIYGYPCPSLYHSLNFHLISILGDITGSKILREKAALWEPSNYNLFQKSMLFLDIKLHLHIFKLKDKRRQK